MITINNLVKVECEIFCHVTAHTVQHVYACTIAEETRWTTKRKGTRCRLAVADPRNEKELTDKMKTTKTNIAT